MKIMTLFLKHFDEDGNFIENIEAVEEEETTQSQININYQFKRKDEN